MNRLQLPCSNHRQWLASHTLGALSTHGVTPATGYLLAKGALQTLH